MESCSSNESKTINFQQEISDMMHGFGDSPQPNPDTVVLVENIVLHQLRTFLQQAYYISEIRGYNVITNYEVIFMMRKNIYKLKQLYDYQLSLDRLDKGLTNSNITEDELLDEFESKARPKLKRNHIDIIEQLDEINEVKYLKENRALQERKLRAVKLAEGMSLEQYKVFHKARCSSFRSGTSQNKYTKLEQWVNPGKELKITLLALEVVGFVAFETVAELVDSAFKVRHDANKPCKRYRVLAKGCGGTAATPSGTNTGSGNVDSAIEAPQVANKNPGKRSRKLDKDSRTTTEAALNEVNNTSGNVDSAIEAPQDANKNPGKRSRKLEKDSLSNAEAAPNEANNASGNVDSAIEAPHANKKPPKRFRKLEKGYGKSINSGLESSPPITEAEIQEVVRRYFMPGGGMNGLFSRNMSQDIPGYDADVATRVVYASCVLWLLVGAVSFYLLLNRTSAIKTACSIW